MTISEIHNLDSSLWWIIHVRTALRFEGIHVSNQLVYYYTLIKKSFSGEVNATEKTNAISTW